MAKREKCWVCRRVIYQTDWVRGLAETKMEGSSAAWDGIAEHAQHTYDCESVTRRLTQTPQDAE